ncbi:chorismate synthase [Haloplasma contractile]|uniref:Chorismate synthase n=1 Tax=Haloplasma contractile SSD-17B TaxID=1033810 RepID=U2FK93_9MOLU|nr:chorismate synthase [Haloplasma contractile]ERJ11654.1 Chorismate synthase protein [Haloplasma contractile SSD-17B]
MFSYLTAGESHGEMLTAIIKSVPSGLKIDQTMINVELKRRQSGYGRGGRMAIEKDRVKITSGIRHGITLGGPIALLIENKDWKNWSKTMSVNEEDASFIDRVLTNPRPGHADLVGGIKYNTYDLRNILERSSARETAIRTAVGAISKQFLSEFNVEVYSHVVGIGRIKSKKWYELPEIDQTSEYFKKVEKSSLRCGDSKKETEMKYLIDTSRRNGDTVGGIIELIITGLPIGLGSFVQWDEKLDGDLAKALMSIQAVKGVEIGLGFEATELPGSKVHDEILFNKHNEEASFHRSSNHSGGLEGGMTTGEPLIIRVAMKPIPTLMKPLRTVDVVTKENKTASKERSDSCAVPACSIITEAVASITIAEAFSKKFGGDSIAEMKQNYRSYSEFVKKY